MPYYTRTPANFLICIALLCMTCAHQQSPSGGPDDTSGPIVGVMTPSPESVSVPTDAKIIITFSEWLLPSSGKGISLFPATRIKTRIKGNRLEIRPLVRLSDSTTYHLVITSTLKDLRNNPISRPLSITFSTGTSLDSGNISGCVSDPARKLLQPSVVLFRAPWKSGDSGFCGPPTYMVQTDSSGIFSFDHIRTGAYFLLAYSDKNSDSRLQTGEDLYTPAESIVTIGPVPVKAVLFPGVFDTTRQSIASVSAIDNRTIVGYWKRPWDTLACPTTPRFRLEPVEPPSRPVNVGYLQSAASSRFILRADTTLDSASYRLMFTMKSRFDSAAVTDTLRIDGAAQPDTSLPFLTKSLPDPPADLRPEICLIWSEPVSFIDTLLLADSLGDSVVITGDTAATDTSFFSIARPLLPGRVYRIVLLTTYGKDLSGNPLRSRDSTDTASIVTITTVRADSIAISLQGGAPCLEKIAQRKWRFKSLAGGRTLTCVDSANTFRFDSLPATKGLIGTFVDYNNNDRPDIGRLLPFVAPEPFIMFEDTIEARARWDVEGVDLGPCDPCERKKVEEPEDSTGIKEKKSKVKK